MASEPCRRVSNSCLREIDWSCYISAVNRTAYGYCHRGWWRYNVTEQHQRTLLDVPSTSLQALSRPQEGKLGRDRFTSCWCRTYQARTRPHGWLVCDEFLAQGDRPGAVGSARRQPILVCCVLGQAGHHKTDKSHHMALIQVSLVMDQKRCKA